MNNQLVDDMQNIGNGVGSIRMKYEDFNSSSYEGFEDLCPGNLVFSFYYCNIII